MRRRGTLTLLALTAVLANGCGYLSAGTWEDDAGNWKRAFRSTRPADVVVLHSRYWRSRHWSYEFQYFFAIAPNAPLKEQLLSANKLRQVRGEEAAQVHAKVFGDPPSWFAPKATAHYEVWVFANEPGRNFKVLIDRSSGHMFINDYKV